ncbi:gas vesicle protein GvpO [Kitasatospora sp. NPDC048365]|uniref:gas vesicle protein GvpO n=1 Tax=Kitasatospora sp. NPDC048365 TaxID=3364050 RepID=UPI003722868A
MSEPRARRSAEHASRRPSADPPRPRRRAAVAEEPEAVRPRRRARPDEEDDRPDTERPARRKAPREEAEPSAPRAAPRLGASQAAAMAARHVQALTGRGSESITSLERTNDGWRIAVEVLESRRIPDSTDILAVYDVVLDDDGELVSYRRAGRYYRGRAEREEEQP